MSIENTYKEILLEKLIKEALEENDTLDPEDVITELTTIVETSDLSVPQFEAVDFHVAPLEEASASKFTQTFRDIRQDLRVLYKETIRLGQRTVQDYERWKSELRFLERKVIDLEDILDDLLLLSQDATNKNFVIDNFTNDLYIDWSISDVKLDITKQVVTLGPEDESTFTKILLNELPLNKISFRVRSNVNLISRSDAVGTTLSNIFDQSSSAWWTTIDMSVAKPVVCELSVELDTENVSLNRIDVDLHDSLQSGPINITPLYSTDNYTFHQLPTDSFSLDVTDTASFLFPTIQARYIKFVLSKAGSDPESRTGVFSYQFGFKDISFYQETYSTSTYQQLVSTLLSALDPDGDPIPFSKLSLEVCERIPDDAKINYYLGVTNDSNQNVNDMLWFPVSAVGATNPQHPSVLDLNDVSELSVGTSDECKVAYDGLSVDNDFINPSTTFHLLSYDGTGAVVDEEVDATAVRYRFSNNNDRLLNFQIKDTDYDGSGSGSALILDETDLVLFRNVGTKGLDTSPSSKVQGIQRGWRFEDPYYVTVIEILNPVGITIDVGNSPIYIDEQAYSNKVPSSVLTGKTSSTTGRHLVMVHKDNWYPVTAQAQSLSSLQTLDKLYPYNHKLLIEGYDYHDDYPVTEEKIYFGVDLFAAHLMKRVGLFDFIHNVPIDGYQYYALDRDLPETHTGGNDPTKVFIVKVDETRSDFQNERFVLRFNLVNQQYQYFRVRADLYTEDSNNTPVLDAYKVKLG